MRYRAYGSVGGQSAQSAVPQQEGQGQHFNRMYGRTLTGVVIATYVQRDGSRAFPQEFLPDPTAVFCDVLIYSTMEGMGGGVITGACVLGSTGMHAGHIWKPRAATIDVTQEALDVEKTDPRVMDGDHVLVGFIEDDLSKPVILGQLPSPLTGLGNSALPEVGHRMLLQEDDGSPDLHKHNGTFWGVDDKGNFVVNTTRAHGGEYQEDGAENPGDDAEHGDVTIKVNSKQSFKVVGLSPDQDEPKYLIEFRDDAISISLADVGTTITIIDDKISFEVKTEEGPDATLAMSKAEGLVVRIDNGASFKVTGKGSGAQLTLGTGGKHVAIVEELKTLYNSLKTKLDAFDAHTHSVPAAGLVSAAPASPVTGSATTATPSPTISAPAWDAAIESSKVIITPG